jgi:Ca2+-binding RTX toxin-like protein
VVPGTALQLDGGGSFDLLTGSNQVNQFTVSGADSGSLSCCGGPVTWSGFENLDGAGGTDSFIIQDGGSLSGAINGHGGTDLLDYGPRTGAVTVNLGLGTASAIAGGIAEIEDVNGGSGDDLIRGDSFNNVLKGGAGHDLLLGYGGVDQLFGDLGQDILIGGAGGDSLFGGAGEDILIGGLTDHDDNDTALLAIMSEWKRTDLTYKHRRDHLHSGGGNNGSYLLNKKSVNNDGQADTLTGEGELDWYFADKKDDSITDKSSGEKEG